MEIKSHFQTNKIILVSPKNILLSEIQEKRKPEETELLRLAASIRKNGLYKPLSVRKQIATKGKFCLVEGVKRYYALLYLQVEKIPVLTYSFTEMEAELFELICDNNAKRSLLQKAEIAFFLLKTGKMKLSELADALGITETHLKELLSVISLSKEEKEFLENHLFSLDFLRIYLSLEAEQKEKALSHMIVNEYSEKEAKKYLKSLKNPKKEPIKTASLSSDTIVINSMERLAESLRQVGISATTEKQDMIDRTEYVLKVEKKLKQLSLL